MYSFYSLHVTTEMINYYTNMINIQLLIEYIHQRWKFNSWKISTNSCRFSLNFLSRNPNNTTEDKGNWDSIQEKNTQGNSLVLHCASLLRTIFISLAHAHERVHVQNLRDFPATKLDSEINAPFLLNEHGDPRFFSSSC